MNYKERRELVAAWVDGQVFRLKHDVNNPNGDRRVKHDWKRAMVLKSGTKFRWARYDQAKLDSWEAPGYLMRVDGGSLNLGDDLFGVIAPVLEPLVETIRDFSSAHDDRHSNSLRAIELLIERGQLSFADAKAAILDAYNEDPDAYIYKEDDIDKELR